MTTTVGGGRLDHSAPGQATQHALLSLSFSLTALQQAGEGAAGGRGNPALSPACRGFTSKGHHFQSPAFRREVFLHGPQE